MKNTEISWTTNTFNPWIGCTHISEECEFCYAEYEEDHRRHRVEWGPGKPRHRTTAEYWNAPLRWEREAIKTGVRPRVFCASLCDVFDADVVQEWRDDLWRLIEQTPHLDWQLLTKRPKNILRMIPKAWLNGFPPHVWIGVSAGNQQRADERIPILLKVPARVRFISAEPLLGPINFGLGDPERRVGISQVIVGGESNGPEERALVERCRYCGGGVSASLCKVCGGNIWVPKLKAIDAVRDIRGQCQKAGVAFFFKQWGGRTHNTGGHLLEGKQYHEFPNANAVLGGS